MSKKKTPKGVFHDLAGGSFSQKKKELLGNVKHSDNEKNIFLKSGSNTGSFSDVNSLSGDDEDVSISGDFDGSLLDSAVNTPKTKRVNTDANFGSPIGSPNFEIDKETTVHDLVSLLEAAGGKTCIINWSLETGNRFRCAVVGFGSDAELESAFCTEPILTGRQYFVSSSSSGFLSSDNSNLGAGKPIFPVDNFSLGSHLVVLECSMELLADQVSDLVCKLSNLDLMLLGLSLSSGVVALSSVLGLDFGADMVLDDFVEVFPSPSGSLGLGPSSSKILTSKVGLLESKLVALEVSIGLVLVKFDGMHVFTSGLNKGFLGAGIAIIMNNSLAWHVSKVEEILGCVIFVHLLFKDKVSVSIIGLYTGVFSGVRFGLASEINSFLAHVVNTSSFVVLGGDFNEDGSKKSASFGFCLSLSLVNSFGGHSLVGVLIWSNSRDVTKVIDYIFVSKCLLSAMARRKVDSVSEFFDTDHLAVLVSVGLGSFLNAHISGVCKQANRDQWKFKLKSVDDTGWNHFKECSSRKLMARMEILKKAMVDSADAIFSRLWFSEFDCTRNKLLSRFYRLELLMSVDEEEASKIRLMINDKIETMDNSIKDAVKKRMENFCLDKGRMIKNILDWPFKKVVLDYLIVNDELILEPLEVKTFIDTIMEGWTRKCLDFSVSTGCCYVNDGAFLGVMDVINMSEFLKVVGDLPDKKTAELSGIPNELWKHGAPIVIDGFLRIFNMCLVFTMGALTNTRPITLIKTAWKILSKIISDRIVSACSNFDILRDTFTQTPIFTIGLVVEDALEKNRELWLVLQDMHKAYDFVGWSHLLSSLVRIKMVNWIMMDFDLTDGYVVHDGLDQGEVFSLLLWRIFYDLLLCKVKKHKQLYGYRMCSKFHTRSGKSDSRNVLTSYFAAATQQILYIASKFFSFNNISINTEKTVAIPINQGVCEAVLHISGSRISVAKKGEFYRYLGIFLSIDSLAKPSLSKAHDNVRFFLNVILRKTITEKQFLYLVSVDSMLQRVLKLKTNLPKNFPNEVLHHPEFYGLRTFEQVLTENLMANLMPQHPLFFPVRIPILPMNCFLAGAMCALMLSNLSLSGTFPNVFCAGTSMPILNVLGLNKYLNVVKSLKSYGFIFTAQMLDHYDKRLDLKDPVFAWFVSLANFVEDGALTLHLTQVNSFYDVGFVAEHLIASGSNPFKVYTDSFIKSFGSVDTYGGTAAYFLDANVSISVCVHGLLSSTLVELHAIALALECVPASSSLCVILVRVHLTLIFITDAESRENIFVKRHSRVVKNERTDFYANAVVCSKFLLPLNVLYYFLCVENKPVSENVHHFVKTLFDSINYVGWESKCMGGVVGIGAFADINMSKSFRALHHRLLVAVKKRLYDPMYLSVLCIRCGIIKDSDHVFLCAHDNNAKKNLLSATRADWSVLVGASAVNSVVAYLLGDAVLSGNLYMLLAKRLVCSIAEGHRSSIWLPAAKLKSFYEKNNILPQDGLVVSSVAVTGHITVGCSIAVMEKAAKASVSGGGFRSILLGKKKRGRVLEGSSGDEIISPKVRKSSS
ncbi:hypothetical protein G9A89_020899 [Geosiphon pyriformis]|nr:hypothetical protein G9A89_020899 [Geosiphon pyriformis]